LAAEETILLILETYLKKENRAEQRSNVKLAAENPFQREKESNCLVIRGEGLGIEL